MNWDALWTAALARWEEEGRRRRLRSVARLGGGRIRVGGRELWDFSSNDYLGLAHHPALAEGAKAFARRWGTGAAGSRLVTGNLEPFEEVERRIAELKGKEAALVFPSGWQTNASLLPALLDERFLGRPPLVFADKLNHASIHHGCRAAGVRQIRYRHLDLDHLEALLVRHQGEKAARFIVSETVFSMDGDRADVAGLAALATRHGAFLYLDEAHATGVLGPKGAGLAAGIEGVDLVMGTFSKALGSQGGYVACSAALRDFLVNRGGGFVYSTGIAPSTLGAIDAALRIAPTLDAERRALQEMAGSLREAFHAAGLDTGGSSTQIVPLILGDDGRVRSLARKLEEAGFLGVPIRPPTVPEGGSRIRLSLSAVHSPEAVTELARVAIEAMER